MALDTITLALNGEVPFDAFTDAITRFRALIQALSQEVGVADNVDWVIHDLEVGSASATIRGEASSPEQVEKVVRAYSQVGKALEKGDPLPFSPSVAKSAQGLLRVLGDRVTSIRFETPEEEATVTSQPGKILRPATTTAYGAVEGRVQTLTQRKGLRFILYDALNDRAISCYVQEGQEEMMRGIWGKRAIVEGLVSREVFSGRPIAVRRISSVRVLPEVEHGSYLEARGIVPYRLGEPLPEELTRRLRDA